MFDVIKSVITFGVVAIGELFPAALPVDSNWMIVKQWEKQEAVYSARLESTTVASYCGNKPAKYIQFPMVLVGAQQISVDGKIIQTFGDPTLSVKRSSYGAPLIRCSDIVNAKVVTWELFALGPPFTRVTDVPRLTSFGWRNLINETILSISVGVLLVLGLLIVILMKGKVPRHTYYYSFFSTICFALFGLASYPEAFGLSIEPIMSIRISNPSLMLGFIFLIRSFEVKGNFLPRFLYGVFLITVSTAALVIVIWGYQLAVTQFGLYICFPFYLALHIFITFNQYRIWICSGERSDLYKFVSLLIMGLIILNDMLLTLQVAHLPFLLPLGFILAYLFLFISLDTSIIETFNQRDRLVLEDANRKHLSQMAENKLLIARQVAHDIKSPVGALGVAINFLPDVNQQVKELILFSIKRIREIADNLLESTRGVNSTTSTEDIVDIIKKVISEKQLIYANNISIQFENRLTGEFWWRANNVELGRIISNLLNNAIEARQDKEIIKIKVKCQVDGGGIQIIITDNGRGIPDELLGRLFNQNVTWGKKEGSGLGLYHAKQLIDVWGGSIEVSSQYGAGTAVAIMLVGN